MNWETLMPNIMLEFMNTFVINDTYICYGYLDKVYVISKQLIIDVFGISTKWQVSKIVTLQALQSCRITHTNFVGDEWNAKNLGWPYFVRCLTIIFVIYQRENFF
jgi:hypothetical protein